MANLQKPAPIKVRITYGKSTETEDYRRCAEKVKKALEDKYGEAKILVTVKKSTDKDDSFEVAIRNEKAETEDELQTIFDKEQDGGLVDSEEKLQKITAAIDRKLGSSAGIAEGNGNNGNQQ